MKSYQAAPQIAHSGRWTLGVYIGLPAAILGALLLLGAFGFFLWLSFAGDDRGDTYTWSNRKVGRVWVGPAAFVALLFVVWMLFAFYPWNSAYHQYREVDGTVTQVSSRLVAGDKATNQKFVVTLQGSSQQFGIDDTRASLLKPGDAVTLSCIKSYQYGAQFGYNCNWGKP